MGQTRNMCLYFISWDSLPYSLYVQLYNKLKLMEVKRPIFVDFSIFNQIYFPEMSFFTICSHFVTH